jgi:hypothetical protein
MHRRGRPAPPAGKGSEMITTTARRARLIVLLALAASGCAVPTTGVVPAEAPGTYTVTRQGAGAWVSTAELKAASLKEAGDFCESKGRTIRVVHTKEVQARPFAGWPEAEVVFSCS